MNVQRAITIKLPWAAAIHDSVKLVENRGRPIPARHIGERIAIHAGATWSKEGGADDRIRQWWWGPDFRSRPDLDATLFSRMFRNVVAVATVADCHQADQTPAHVTCCLPKWGDREYGNAPAWHIVLADVKPLDQLVGPVRGALQVPWTLPTDVAAQVNDQIGAAA